MKEKTCWMVKYGSCIDLILSNKGRSLMNTGAVETGLSNHHLLIHTMLKTTFAKLPPIKVVYYRCYKHFNGENFRKDLENAFLTCTLETYSEFESILSSIIDKHAPLKSKFLRANNRPHVAKELRKAIMYRSKLKHIATKTKNPEDMKKFRAQRNLAVQMNREAKGVLL